MDDNPNIPEERKGARPTSTASGSVILDNIRSSLKQKDDTSRFVGLTMLKSFLDSPSELQNDDEVLLSLWQAISPKFLDRLVRSKGGGKKDGTPSTLDLGVSIIHKFTLLLPESAKRDKRLVDRIPTLVESTLQSSEETTQLIAQTLLELVTFPEGAHSLTSVDDTSPLVEVAPTQPLVLDVFERAWLNSMIHGADKASLRRTVDVSIKGLVSSFKGTDGVTLLRFVGDFLRKSDPLALPLQPKWVKPVTDFIKTLLPKKPNPEARHAYTLASASLLEMYPADASQLLFSGDASTKAGSKGEGKSKSKSILDEKPFSYLLVSLVLTEIKSMAPRLLSLLNDPTYPETAKRLASALDIVTHFIGYLVRAMDAMEADDDADDAGTGTSMMPAEFLLKLRTSISETTSLVTEFLRDRWDASVAGAMGLHPDARPGAAEQWIGSLPITWESTRSDDTIHNDPLVLAAVRTMALWLREDDNRLLRKEAAGLTDMFLDLYKSSGEAGAARHLDFRSPVLVAFEGLVAEDKGVAAFADNGGWKVLAGDLLGILQTTSGSTPAVAPAEVGAPVQAPVQTQAQVQVQAPSLPGAETARGLEIVRVLLPFVEAGSGTEEDWMGLVTGVAAWSPPVEGEGDSAASRRAGEFWAAALQLVTTLLANAHGGMRKRFVHTAEAVVGTAKELRERLGGDGGDAQVAESLDDVIDTLEPLSIV